MRFLNGEDLDDADLEKELLINTKLDNIKKIKFDDKKWEIDPTRFIIHGKFKSYIFTWLLFRVFKTIGYFFIQIKFSPW